MAKQENQLEPYETPLARVKDILFENCILSEDDTLGGGAGEDAGDELYPGF